MAGTSLIMITPIANESTWIALYPTNVVYTLDKNDKEQLSKFVTKHNIQINNTLRLGLDCHGVDVVLMNTRSLLLCFLPKPSFVMHEGIVILNPKFANLYVVFKIVLEFLVAFLLMLFSWKEVLLWNQFFALVWICNGIYGSYIFVAMFVCTTFPICIVLN